MRCELKDGDGVLLVDPDPLEDDVRYGRVTLDQLVRIVPGGRAPAQPGLWPQDGDWHAVRTIPALADAAKAPAAVLGDRFRHPPRTLLAPLLAVLLAVVFAVGVVRADDFDAFLGHYALGFVPTLVDAGWYTPWTGALLHVNVVHFLSNLPILLYCGWRVERVTGPSGYLVVVAAAVLGATPLVAWFSDLPVVGASIVAFGLWGAQIALGLRLGDRIPPGWRSRYGWGNLVFFVPLFLSGLGQPGVSDLGHVGGLIGGVVAAFLTPLEGLAAEVGPVRRRTLVLAAAVAATPCIGVAIAARSPALLSFPGTVVEEKDDAYTLTLPQRLAVHELRVGAVPAWTLSPNLDLPFFAALFEVSREVKVDAGSLADFWTRRLGGTVTPLDTAAAPSSLGDGWVVYRFHLDAVPGFDQGGVITQHTRVSGRYAWGIGWIVGTDHAISPGLEAWYTRIASTVQLGDPPELAEAKSRHELHPDSASYRYDYALALDHAGRYTEMAAVLEKVAAESEGGAWDAMRVTLDAWELDHSVAVDATTLDRFVGEASPRDLALLRPGFDWYVARGDCVGASRVHGVLVAYTIPEGWDADDRGRFGDEVDRQTVALTTCAPAAP